MFRKIVIGGTFNGLHEGHKRLIETGFENAESAVIGLTSDEFANRFRAEEVRPFESRMRELEEYVGGLGKPYSIVEINDSYGVATIDPEVDSIVVSEETLLRAEEINTIRFKKKLHRLVMIVVPLVLDEKGIPVSSSR
ncbi:MAG: pantetheine-phosphate adenylyltransferase [Candidatus Altiarchaeota archaeon]